MTIEQTFLRIIPTFATMVCAVACSEAADTTESSSTSSTSAMTSVTSSTSGAGGSSSASTAATASSSSAAGSGGGAGLGLVLNEVSGVGDDYIELYNAGSEAVDLAGLQVADDEAGAPKVAEAVTFPAGTTLAPGKYLFILADQKSAAPGPQTTCDPGPSPCFHATFGVSKSGDVLYLLDASDKILESVAFPADLLDGQTWGRFPNGSGTFVLNKPTPGTANAKP